MSWRLYDAHNHLQDERFGGRQSELIAACTQTGVVAMVMNGSCEADWPQVLALARRFPFTRPSATLSPSDGERDGVRGSPTIQGAHGVTRSTSIIPSFGYHPWYIHERAADWLQKLAHYLDEIPSAVGEIGLDRWKPGLSYEHQEEVFIAQLRLAAERNLPVSIHCLQAWGRMLEILQTQPRPARGFLLHSYGGSKEMVTPFAELGAYFSLPGYYAHERKVRQRQAFQHVPAERLLIETDAPDQNLPEIRGAEGGGRINETRSFFRNAKTYRLTDSASGQALNHPANLAAVYAFAAELRGVTDQALSAQVEQNFLRLFGGL
jgi:TatD DNase family protein